MKGNCTRLERYNGSTWDLIARRVSISGPARSRETVEEELTIDCSPSGGTSTKRKAPGTKEIGDITVEVLWNPVVTSGVLQQETATAAGTASVSGNVALTLTSAVISGSPLALSVPITGAAPAEWAEEVREFLDSHPTVSNYFTISGTGPSIVLTRKPDADGMSPVQDATLNLAIAPGTATGVTAAATSTDTRSAVPGPVNPENHHLFASDFNTDTATFWRITHSNSINSGVITHATVKELGEPSYQANETVKRQLVLEPTGEYHFEGNSITAVTLPPSPAAPRANWGR